jgi:hypothetical protein
VVLQPSALDFVFFFFLFVLFLGCFVLAGLEGTCELEFFSVSLALHNKFNK